MEQGLFREAETIAQGVVRIERLPVVMHLPALTVLGRVRVRLEDGGGIELLHQALAEGLPTGEPQRIVPVRFGLIEAAWLAGDIETAREQLAEIASFDLKNLRSWDLGEFAVWWRRCGIKKKLPALPGTLPLARAAEVGGDALKAADEWERLGLPYEAALSLLQVDTVEAVTRAITMLDAIEAKTAGDLARKQARDLGVDTKPATKPRRGPYGASRHHPLGLTTNEQQVLALIAEGKSNKEVARSLSRSPRTVEHQVSAVLGKFNATNRMEVLLRLRAEPWLLSSAGAHHGEM
jgi:DNA-binding CsgD family transcriptional regulator